MLSKDFLELLQINGVILPWRYSVLKVTVYLTLTKYSAQSAQEREKVSVFKACRGVHFAVHFACTCREVHSFPGVYAGVPRRKAFPSIRQFSVPDLPDWSAGRLSDRGIRRLIGALLMAANEGWQTRGICLKPRTYLLEGERRLTPGQHSRQRQDT